MCYIEKYMHENDFLHINRLQPNRQEGKDVIYRKHVSNIISLFLIRHALIENLCIIPLFLSFDINPI